MGVQAQNKNVLLISLDDAVAFWKYKSVFGAVLQTPNLDRICGVSTAFHAAYAQAPVCSPSRASFMSGRAPHQSGVTGPAKRYFDRIPPEAMWPHALRRAGYYCSSGGKVMLGYSPLPEAAHKTLFDDRPKRFMGDFFLPEDRRVEFGGFRGGRAPVDDAGDDRLYDARAARSAIRFLRKYEGDAPFYREVGFFGPHGPWITPRRFKEMYDVRAFRRPAAWAAGFPENAQADLESPPNFPPGKRLDWKKSVRNYFSALSHVDHQLGRVWDALKASPHADNTLVVILSDHGLHLGDRGRFRKHTLWEQVANVPLIVHDPARPTAQAVSDPVALIDVGPTVMDHLGLPPIEGSPGRSLLPQLGWARDPDRAVPTFFGDSASVRQGRYRFIRYADGSTQLFDLAEDWWQTRDLGAEHPAHAEMRAVHAACCAEYGMDVGALDAAPVARRA